jgi:multicomponent K+:H+ antiporter subunit F
VIVTLALDITTGVIALAMAMNLARLYIGPTVTDRILALDTLNINALALLVLFGMRLGSDVFFEAALIIAMLGFVATVALAKFVIRRDIIE